MLPKKRDIGEQSQKIGDESTGYQAARDIIITNGVSYTEVKGIVMDLFRLNAYELLDSAGAIANARAEEVIEKYIERLQSEAPESVTSLNQPDMQYALLNAQKAHARVGDENLADVLVDILVERSKEPQRNLMQVILNEALEVAPKLTSSQIDILSTLFLLRYVKFQGLNQFFSLKNYIISISENLIENLPLNESMYSHLQYSGCGRIDVTSIDIIDTVLNTYKDAFRQPIERDELNFLMLPRRGIRMAEDLISRNIIVPFNYKIDESKEYFILYFNDVKQLEERLFFLGYPEQIYIQANTIFNRMASTEDSKKILMYDPNINKLLSSINQGSARSFSISSVGMVIAQANIKRKLGFNLDISIWVNEN